MGSDARELLRGAQGPSAEDIAVDDVRVRGDRMTSDRLARSDRRRQGATSG